MQLRGAESVPTGQLPMNVIARTLERYSTYLDWYQHHQVIGLHAHTNSYGIESIRKNKFKPRASAPNARGPA
jgi:hypothetical protein